MIKVKEKFDKCNKENLMEFCDLLDMPVTNANTRKVCWFNPVDINKY
jgi:protein DEK